MTKKKIKKGDKVIAITGNEKGRQGTVIGFKGEDRVLVQGLNIRKKAVRKSEENPKGSFLDIEAPIHISNLALYDEDLGKVKVAVKTEDNGDKSYVYKKDTAKSHRAIKRAKK